METLQLLHRKKIDEAKWVELLARCKSFLPYTQHWWLDAVAEDWGAIVLGDYEAALPLCRLRKLALNAVYQPYFTQQLGLFSAKKLDDNTRTAFFLKAQKHYSFIQMNIQPNSAVYHSNVSLRAKTNLLLPLKDTAEKLQAGYSENLLRNIRKAQRQGLQAEQISRAVFTTFYFAHIPRVKENFSPKHEHLFNRLAAELEQRQMGEFWCAKDVRGNALAVCLLVRGEQRLINLVNCGSKESKQTGATHFLLDHVLTQNAGNNLVFDFEGSQVEGVARFYRSFGAVDEVFYEWNFRSPLLQILRQ